MMATKKSGQTKDCHKDKADHSAVCIWKKVQKGGKKWQLNVKAHQKSIMNWGPVAQGRLDSSEAML